MTFIVFNDRRIYEQIISEKGSEGIFKPLQMNGWESELRGQSLFVSLAFIGKGEGREDWNSHSYHEFRHR